jgi:hypothetical protein
MPKALQEVEELKRMWLADPIWDIEKTEGFEDFHDELLIYRLHCENAWQADRINEMNELAAKWGMTWEGVAMINSINDQLLAIEETLRVTTKESFSNRINIDTLLYRVNRIEYNG